MGQNIEIVHSYKYLGTIIDDKLRWDENTTNIFKKGQQRLYFLRKLNALHVDRNILSLFHDSFVKSVMTFGLICWWGNISVKNRAKLSKLHTISCKIVGCCTPDSSLQKLYNMPHLLFGLHFRVYDSLGVHFYVLLVHLLSLAILATALSG